MASARAQRWRAPPPPPDEGRCLLAASGSGASPFGGSGEWSWCIKILDVPPTAVRSSRPPQRRHIGGVAPPPLRFVFAPGFFRGALLVCRSSERSTTHQVFEQKIHEPNYTRMKGRRRPQMRQTCCHTWRRRAQGGARDARRKKSRATPSDDEYEGRRSASFLASLQPPPATPYTTLFQWWTETAGPTGGRPLLNPTRPSRRIRRPPICSTTAGAQTASRAIVSSSTEPRARSCAGRRCPWCRQSWPVFVLSNCVGCVCCVSVCGCVHVCCEQKRAERDVVSHPFSHPSPQPPSPSLSTTRLTFQLHQTQDTGPPPPRPNASR